jgi:hypothetical protein
LKDNFLAKMSFLAPNIKHLSLKGMQISDKAFATLVSGLHDLETVDISDCPNIEDKGIIALFENNKRI